MATLNITEIGSVLLNMIDNVPDSISGTLPTMISQEISNANNYAGLNIGTSVEDKYQPPIFSLSAAAVLNMMALTGADVSNIKLGEFSVSKGSSSNLADTSSKMRADGLAKLNNLGGAFSSYQVI